MLNKNVKTSRNILVLIMATVLLSIACIGVLGIPSDRASVSASERREIPQTVELYSGAPKVTGLRSGETVCVSQTVAATITPSTVVDKYVTWTLAWAPDAPLKDADISEYLEVTEESQGNLTATVNCYKAFRGSRAILTCTTRQGNKQGTCEVVYEGVPSSMSINPPTSVETFNLGRDTVDLLFVGQAYSLNIISDNVFHDAGNGFDDYEVIISGAGTITCGTYSRSPRGAGWASHNNVVDVADIASEFITASVTGDVVSVTPSKAFRGYYESSTTHYVEGNGETTTYTNMFYAFNTDADGNLPYFILTVRHRTLGFSAQYRFFIGEEIESVRMNTQTITF